MAFISLPQKIVLFYSMATVRIIGIIIMFLGIGLKIANLPGYTAAFIVGAILIILARLYQWRNIRSQKP